MSAVAARRKTVRLRVGDMVTGWSYVEPEGRGQELPQLIVGTVSQIGSGWTGVDDAVAYVWVRLPSGREAKALTGELEKTTDTGAGAGGPGHLLRRD
ncbi:hypothetical protein J7F03_39460 [Streptomyces sp. ISL-43]|uniref:hypothetical protein n=1 Tax=Streptomyces sp. ISL-43 TaxID=2819183 RepID=UPI001BECDF13|nr:hypothetical protein [Streptomyces sp. ISL-43]MBT2453004.1 hypothetical protein [Streptomyces sp. ISL-43]